MSHTVIAVENISKLYRLGTISSGTLSHDLNRWWARLRGRPDPLLRIGEEERSRREDGYIWALRDVSFAVEQGEVLGIIGRNGAGKSTLLKILSRVTTPTSGEIKIKGRIASLLEVGTGFHPELTGRENIFMNGAILGMTRAEIRRKFDEIVAFAEIEQFIDTPVKRYSSGMYVRLAFAVAAHLEPEILLVDEVLAVGDAAFQKKCLGKMGEVAKEGRTVLFVSHNMAAVLSLCSEATLLSSGRIACNGPTENVVTEYMQGVSPLATTPLHERSDRTGDGSVRLMSISISNGDGNSLIRCSDHLRVRIGYLSTHEVSQAVFLVAIYDQLGRPIFFLDTQKAGGFPDVLPASGFVTCVTGPINITPDLCVVNAAVLVGGVMADQVKQACTFEVEADDFYGTGKLTSRQMALCLLKQEWQVENMTKTQKSGSRKDIR